MSTTRAVYLLADRYRLDDRIAAGGMGQVWRATDLVLGRPVAVKLLRAEYAQHPETLARFRAEARHAGSLSHPNIARIYDYGEADAAQPPFLVMELVDGPPLTQLLARGPMQPARVMDVVAQAADGLGAAHAAGLVHRDVKPGNLLLAPPGLVKITDFGIAYAAGSAPITRTGMLVGTPAYVAPERVTGSAATPASDWYSLGIVAYECLAGALPFCGTAMEVALSHQMRALPPLPAAVPAEAAALVAELTAKDPTARPASAGEIVTRARRLRDVLAAAPSAGPAPPSAEPLSPSAGPAFWPAPLAAEADAGAAAPSAEAAARPTPPPAEPGEWAATPVARADAWPAAPSAEPGEWAASPSAEPGEWAASPSAEPGDWAASPSEPGDWAASPSEPGDWLAAPSAWPASPATRADAWEAPPYGRPGDSPGADAWRGSPSAGPGAWPAAARAGAAGWPPSQPAAAADAQADTLAGPQATQREIGMPGPPRPAQHRLVPRGRGRRRRLIVLAVAAAAVIALAGWVLGSLTGGAAPHRVPVAPSSTGSTPHTRPATSPATPAVQVNGGALIGQPVRDVTQRLRRLGLGVQVQFTRTASQPPGTVVSVQPTGQLAAGSTVVVTAALPPLGHGNGRGHDNGHGGDGGNGHGGDGGNGHGGD